MSPGWTTWLLCRRAGLVPAGGPDAAFAEMSIRPGRTVENLNTPVPFPRTGLPETLGARSFHGMGVILQSASDGQAQAEPIRQYSREVAGEF
jgi:hypothetical protein